MAVTQAIHGKRALQNIAWQCMCTSVGLIACSVGVLSVENTNAHPPHF